MPPKRSRRPTRYNKFLEPSPERDEPPLKLPRTTEWRYSTAVEDEPRQQNQPDQGGGAFYTNVLLEVEARYATNLPEPCHLDEEETDHDSDEGSISAANCLDEIESSASDNSEQLMSGIDSFADSEMDSDKESISSSNCSEEEQISSDYSGARSSGMDTDIDSDTENCSEDENNSSSDLSEPSSSGLVHTQVDNAAQHCRDNVLKGTNCSDANQTHIDSSSDQESNASSTNAEDFEEDVFPCPPFQQEEILQQNLNLVEENEPNDEPPSTEPYFFESHVTLKEKLRGSLSIISNANPKISCAEFLLNILTLVSHFKLNFAEFEGIMKLINSLFQQRMVPDTRYLLDSLFLSMSGIHYHFVCYFCSDYLGEYDHTEVPQILCNNCEKVNVISNLNKCTFFIMFDLAQQVELLLSQNELFENLKNPLDLKNNERTRVMKDLYDGEMYQKFISRLDGNGEVVNISICFSVDGAALYTSSNGQIWPLFCCVLELPPNIRAHNLLLAGLWFGKGHAPLDVFLTPFASQCKQMSNVGFTIRVKGVTKTIKCHCLCCCADAPARAGVQGIHQHGGGYCCHWCLHPTENRICDILDYEPDRRTQREIIADGTAASVIDYRNASVNGVNNLSPMLRVPSMDIVDGMVLEYFHASAQGIAKLFLNAWLGEDGCEGIPYYIGSPTNINKMDKLLKSIRMPIEARRPSRDMSDAANWKGRDLENFILYLSVVLLTDILPKRYLQHWSLFVQAMHFLLQEEVSEYHLEEARRLLKSFGRMVKDLYPRRFLTYNLHIISEHLVDNCIRWGPLWSINGYCFEDGNRILKNNIHATKGIASQVCRAYSHNQALEILRSYASTPFSQKFQSDLEKKVVNSCVYINEDKYFGTAKKKYLPSPQEAFLCEQRGIDPDTFLTASKLIHKGCVYSISKYCTTRTDNSVALLLNGDILEIDKIIMSEVSCEGYLIGRMIRSAPHFITSGVRPQEAFLRLISYVHRDSVIVSPSELKISCARITVPHGDYLIKVPNIFNTS